MFGEAANLPLLLAITIENGILMPFTIALLEIDRAGRGAVLQASIVALKAVLRNPIVMPVLLGAAFALLGIQLPALVEGIVKLVRGATVPCALFALGATLVGLPLTERLRETSFMVAMKLVAYPVLIYLVMSLFLPKLDPVWRSVAILSAAMPIGANLYLIAARYQVYEESLYSHTTIHCTLCCYGLCLGRSNRVMPRFGLVQRDKKLRLLMRSRATSTLQASYGWCVMSRTRLMYLELKSGYEDNGPAWIARVAFSKNGGRTVYFNGRALSRSSGQGIKGNHYDPETGDEWWISGVKKDGTDRHWAGGGIIKIATDVVQEYLEFVGRGSVNKSRFEICTGIVETDIGRLQEQENKPLG